MLRSLVGSEMCIRDSARVVGLPKYTCNTTGNRVWLESQVLFPVVSQVSRVSRRIRLGQSQQPHMYPTRRSCISASDSSSIHFLGGYIVNIGHGARPTKTKKDYPGVIPKRRSTLRSKIPPSPIPSLERQSSLGQDHIHSKYILYFQILRNRLFTLCAKSSKIQGKCLQHTSRPWLG